MIEPGIPENYAEITELWEASVRATHHFLREADIQFYKPLILNEYLKAVDLYCKKDQNHRIIGFLGTSADKIEMLFIDPAARGKGIGKELLQFAINHLNIKKVDVNEQNEQALGFYRHFGFVVTGRTAVDGMGKPYPILNLELSNFS
jgi:putative acetyltransferase